MSEAWDEIANWWVDAVRDDPRDSSDLLDMVADLTEGTGGLALDLGCGEGQVMRLVGPPIIGMDVSERLLKTAAKSGPTVLGRLPDLRWVRPGAFQRALCVGVVEMVRDHDALFAASAAAVAPGGHLVVVMNHPVATTPTSEPLADPNGEILWRWGDYLSTGELEERVEDQTMVLHHRPLGELLSAAAAQGWGLDRLIERGPSEATVARFPEYRGQEHIPTLLGCRWIRDR